MSGTDESLIDRFKSGDATAFEALFERHADRVYGFAQRMCGHAEDAQDVVQETFMAALKGLKEFRKQSRLSTWLYKVASSVCLKKRRKRKGEPKQTLSIENFIPDTAGHGRALQIPDWSSLADDKVYNKQLSGMLREAILELPREYRIVLVLRDMEGLSARETGRALGISVAAVKSRLHRARLFVRERLGKTYENA